MTLGDLVIRLVIQNGGAVQQTAAVTSGLKSVDAAGKSAAASVKNFSAGLKTIAGYTAGILSAGTATRLFIGFLKSSVSAFLEDEQAAQKLKAALDGNTAAFNNLRKQADRLQQESKGLFSNELINNAQTFLADQNRTEAQIQKTIEAAVKLSVVTGKDLLSSVKELDGTQEGVVGRLSKLDKGFGDLTNEQLQNGAAIDLVNSKYSNWQEKLESTKGKINNLTTAYDEFKKGVGGGLIEQLTQGLEDAGNAADVSQQSFNNAGKAVGIFIGWIARGAVTGMVFFKVMNLVIEAGKRSAVILKDAARSVLDLVDNFGSFVSNIPVIGDAWDRLKNAAEPYLNKLREIIGAQKQINSGGALPEDQYTSDGRRVNTKDPMKDPANQSGRTRDTDNKGSKPKKIKEEKDALQLLREQVEKLQKQENELIELRKKDNLSVYERLQLYIQLLAVQKELAELQFKGIRNIPGSLTSQDIKEEELKIKKRSPDSGGGTDERFAGIQFDRDAWAKRWAEGINFATQIINILNQRPENLFSAFQQLLQIASAIAAMMGLASAGPLGAAAGLFGVLGKILPFNKGTDPVVPGTGNTDSVLSWLTPGEVVINKPRVMQLVSQYGMGFIKWLNGGGSLLPAIPGHYNSGGIVQNIISERQSVRGMIQLNGKILNRRERRRIAKDGLYVENVTAIQSQYN